MAAEDSKFEGSSGLVVGNFFFVHFLINLAYSISVALLEGHELLALQVQAFVEPFYPFEFILMFLEVLDAQLHFLENLAIQFFNLFVEFAFGQLFSEPNHVLLLQETPHHLPCVELETFKNSFVQNLQLLYILLNPGDKGYSLHFPLNVLLQLVVNGGV